MKSNHSEQNPQPGTSAIPSQFLRIPGVDAQTGIAMTGGTVAGYQQVLSMFCKDVKERLQLLRFILFQSSTNGNKFPEKQLPAFITQVHAIKSASASLGANEISKEATLLEEAGNTNDLPLILLNLESFLEHLSNLEENIRKALDFSPEETEQKSGSQESEKAGLLQYSSIFQSLADALKSQNVSDIDRFLTELNNIPFDTKIKEILDQISDQVLMTEFDNAVQTIDNLLAGNS